MHCAIHRSFEALASQDDKSRSEGDGNMQDILWIVVTIAFFVVSIGYVRFCDRVK